MHFPNVKHKFILPASTKSHIFALVMVLSALGSAHAEKVVAQAGSKPFDPETELIKRPWHADNLWLRTALEGLAFDLNDRPGAPLIACESYVREYVAIDWPNEQGQSPPLLMAANPNLSIFSFDSRGKTWKTALDEICAKAGKARWRYDARWNVICVAQNDLDTNAAWPLNQTLGEDAGTTLSVEQVLQLLRSKYSLTPDYSARDLAREFGWNPKDIDTLKGLVVWQGNQNGRSTPRDLYLSMLRALRFRTKPGARAPSVFWLYPEDLEAMGLLSPYGPKYQWSPGANAGFDETHLKAMGETMRRVMREDVEKYGILREDPRRRGTFFPSKPPPTPDPHRPKPRPTPNLQDKQ